MVRLSFAVRLPESVLDLVRALPRPVHPEVVWSSYARWIVTVRPLGHVPVDLHPALLETVATELDGAPPAQVVLGPLTRRMSGQWLGAPVAGLDELAAAVFAASAPLVAVTHPQPFAAHLVLARGHVPKELAGAALTATWLVEELLLVADRSSPHGPRVEDLGAIALR